MLLCGDTMTTCKGGRSSGKEAWAGLWRKAGVGKCEAIGESQRKQFPSFFPVAYQFIWGLHIFLTAVSFNSLAL